jgi:hypothetical protein
MTGNGWLDGSATTVFAAVTLFSVVRLLPRRTANPGGKTIGECGRHGSFADAGFHAVMGLAMVTMFWPGPAAARTWIAVLGGIGLWSTLVLARAIRPVPPTREPEQGADRVSQTPGPRLRESVGRAGYYLASGLVMILALGAGPMRGSPAGSSLTAMPSMPATEAIAMSSGDRTGLMDTIFGTLAGWPIWPAVALTFAAYAGWLAFGRHRRSPTERTCAVAMAAGMALMAAAL